MTVRHREVFPEGSSPDSIDWRIWNAEHEVTGGIPGQQSLQDVIDIGNTWQIAGDTEPRIQAGTDGALYFGDGATAIGSATPRLGVWPSTGQTFTIAIPGGADFMIRQYGDEVAEVLADIEIQPSTAIAAFVTDSGPTVGSPRPNTWQWVWENFYYSGGIAVQNYTFQPIIDPTNPSTDSYHQLQLAGFSIGGSKHFRWRVDGHFEISDGSAILGNCPTSDPAVAGELFSVDAAGLAAALAAGARYVLVSDGP